MKQLLTLFSVLMLWIALATPSAYAEEASPFEVAAIVNNEAITQYDVLQRIRFVIATTGMPATPQTAEKLFPRILNTLIEELLQRQEAKRYNISVSEQEIAAAISQIEKEQGKPEGSLLDYLQKNDINRQTIEDQIRTQIGWSKLLQQRVVPRLKVSDKDVSQALQQRLQQEKSVEEVQISSLILPVTAQEKPEDAKKLAEELTQKLRDGVPMRILASQLADKELTNIQPTWVALRDLDPQLASNIANKDLPAVLGPAQTPAGYQILQVHELRRSDYRTNVEALFKEIILTLDYDAQKPEVDALMVIAREVRRTPGSCTEKEVASMTNIDELEFEVNYVRTTLKDMSQELLPFVRNLHVGEVSEPFATPEGIRLLKLCERVELPSNEINTKELRYKLKEEKFRQEAMRYIRNLKRDAFIDIRI